MAGIKRALISVSDKTGVVEMAKGLEALGAEILSTGGTAKALRDAGVTVTDVASYTGAPEILDGRVKTLHPKIHGGLLGRRSVPAHVEQMAQHHINPIDVVVVNLYPFEATIANPHCRFEDAIENIDIGGPSMLRSAAKNHEDVLVVVDPADYTRVLDAVKADAVTGELRRELAMKVFQHTARYDGLIAGYLEKQVRGGEVKFPKLLSLQFELGEILRYGENPHQQGAFYREAGSQEPSVSRGKILHGKAMSYNNFLDANAALELAKEYDECAVAIIKHNNPCGVALGETPVEAYVKARETDPVSAFGGVIAFNRPVDLAAAKEITSTFVEVVIAPGFAEDALAELKRKKDLRLLDVGPLTRVKQDGYDLKKLVGGLIVQDRDLGALPDLRTLQVPTARKPTDDEYAACAFAWKVCKHVKSNAIVYARPGQTVGIGAGQMSRVDSVKLAAMKAQLPIKGCVMASDAFFPFRDGLDAAAQAGITAVIQPGGSIRDAEVIKAADEHGMAMILTGMRHFRH
ncbi:bifunctional phosphoribosylaminoimidazolecarboxamide formyltransferase/IMP cyclohydrolase [Candidatus Nitrospira inopinata]|jgi:phosphoribosylaminoimidazolecarboxamide formyltransferase/IMP cyclohydrolase|uniref:Bifunctional purine biosynthesis protein PurH n=1 Tax=Candidatus Nitrospira inopinata TaxID=1715989 RepID=A0A0S4KW79_9BACT|nr:bifunctional phosphoribosylaminoimidazolecarboxamide formyltransferase/IMP cyclohydrolase [Candidatus Nitrospira inopinata]CUQ67645.1 fused IMP cyclohydrolase; phosphoribosylaminoimidazolecarboxamide formyltransferase [Candidatus Nitrospira inopinata]